MKGPALAAAAAALLAAACLVVLLPGGGEAAGVRVLPLRRPQEQQQEAGTLAGEGPLDDPETDRHGIARRTRRLATGEAALPGMTTVPPRY